MFPKIQKTGLRSPTALRQSAVWAASRRMSDYALVSRIHHEVERGFRILVAGSVCANGHINAFF